MWQVPHYTRWGLYPQALIVVGCLFCFQWWPLIPTVAIGFLGVVAAIMAVRADHFSLGERVVYVFIAFALFIVEMTAVYRDRDQHDREQTELRIREAEARKKESDSFAALIKEGHGLFQTIQHVDRLAEKSLETLTGGDQYCWIAPMESNVLMQENIYHLWVMNSGKAILPYCDVSIISVPPELIGKNISLGDLHPLKMHFDKLPGNPTGNSSYLSTYHITNDRNYSLSIRTPTRTLSEVITFNGFLAHCEVVDTTNGKILEKECMRPPKPIKRHPAP
jgi:hypothetical protein